MIRLTIIELFKMSRRPRSYIGFAALLAINILFMLGMKYGGLDRELAGAAGRVGGLGVIGSPANGEFLAWTVAASPAAISILTMFMPFFVCMIFGEIFAGENAEGTLRTVLARPITRSSLFTAKFAASAIYAACLVFFLGISAYVIGVAAFGRGGLLTVDVMNNTGMIAWFSEGEGFLRLGLCYALTFVGMTCVGTAAFFISVWLGNSMGAIGGAIGLLYVLFIVGEISWFKPIHEYLFSTHFFVGTKAFLDPIPWRDIGSSVICLGAYVVAFLVISALILKRKDILA